MDNDKAVYACLNYGEAFCPEEIEDRSICIDGDIDEVLKQVYHEGEKHTDIGAEH